MAIQPSIGVSNREPWIFVNNQGFHFGLLCLDTKAYSPLAPATSKLLGILDVCSYIVGGKCRALVDCTHSWEITIIVSSKDNQLVVKCYKKSGKIM